jgi:hypothetical protein
MKQKKQLAVLVALLLTAGVIWFLYFDFDKPIVTTVVGAAQNPQLLSVENPQLHTYGVEKARNTEYKSGRRNIFSRELPPPPPPPPVHSDPGPKGPYVPPPPVIVPPTVSPLPVKFFGFGTIPNGTSRRAFLTDGENVYIVAEGEIFLNRFRILKIGNANLEYEEVSSGLRGTAILEEQGAPPSA